MLDRLIWKRFADIDVNDVFFDSLREDYDGFDQWFLKKSKNDEKAMILTDEIGVHAFLYLKLENEPIKTVSGTIPAKNRIKIGTLKLDETIGRQRLGEGIIGVALWKWQESKAEEVYVTVFEKQEKLVGLFNKFGFECFGKKGNGELILGKSRRLSLIHI